MDIPASDLEERVWAAAELIEPYLQSDPKKEQSMGQIRGCQAEVETWFRDRSAYMESIGL